MINTTEIDYPTTEAEILEAIFHNSRSAGEQADSNDAMKFSQAALNLAHALSSLNRIGERS
mgnify:CR=1 FL=1|jgi:hypothetical protein